MNKKETYDFLNFHGISYEITEHKAVYNMADLAAIELPYPEADDLVALIKEHGNTVSFVDL